MTRPFEIPEILDRICEKTSRSDLAKLSTTSRLFFECAVPFIWRNLPEAAPMVLLGLLPDAEAYLNTNLGGNFVETLLQSLQPLDSQSLARFNFYAPYVKRVPRHYQNQQSNIAWDRLFKLVKARPILPNLEVLEVSLSRSYSKGISQSSTIPSLAPFLSPNLLEINSVRIIDTFSHFDAQTFAWLISMIAQGCPRLTCLKLKAMTRSSFQVYHSTQLAASLGQLRNLRTIQLGLAMPDPEVLVVLGVLPHLESLTLNEAPNLRLLNNSKGQSTTPSTCISHGYFPALRHLGLCIDDGFELRDQIQVIIAMVCRLTSVSVHIFGRTTHDAIRDFIDAIHRSNPLVTYLNINCADLGEIRLLTPIIVDSLVQLPLRRLQLIGKYGFGWGDYPGGEELALALPNVESLLIRGYTFSLKDLVFMAKHMPRLQELSIPVRVIEGWPSKDPLHGFTPSPSRLKLHFVGKAGFPSGGFPTPAGFNTIDNSSPAEKVRTVAACLHALWPSGVTCTSSRKPDTTLGAGWVSDVNAELGRLHEADGHGCSENGTV